MRNNANIIKIISVENWKWFNNLNYGRKGFLRETLKKCHPIFPESFSLFIESLLNSMQTKNKNSIILFKSSGSSIKHELIIEPNKVELAKNYKEFLFKCEIINGEATMKKYDEHGLEIFKNLFTELFEEKEIFKKSA